MPARIIQLKITIEGIQPPIWRRFLVSENTTLLKLHDVVQEVMGWTNSHLHMFRIDGICFMDPRQDPDGDLESRAEDGVKLKDFVNAPGRAIEYEYDFGDSWNHTIEVEQISAVEKRFSHPRCLAGARACPPEDVGGIGGYQNFLEAIADPAHEEHAEYLAWVGGFFDPEAFDLAAVNAQLRAPRQGRVPEAAARKYVNFEHRPAFDPAGLQFSPVQAAEVQRLTLCRDAVVLLEYLRDQRVIGASTTGNFPLKAAREICARFADPPALETRIGSKVFKVRSAGEVWPLRFLHVLASAGGFIEGGPGRRWKLTELGQIFLKEAPERQAARLFAAWWLSVDWDVALYHDIELPYWVEERTLKALLELDVETEIPVKPFARRLAEAIGYAWPEEGDDSTIVYILQGMIERMVLDPNGRLGVLAVERVPDKDFGGRMMKLLSFRVTPFGRYLLEALASG